MTSTDNNLFFVCRLIGPRADFIATMTEAERTLMQAHAGWWMQWMARGKVIVFGPVADPKGPWGLGVVQVQSEAEMRAMEQGDPVIKAGCGFRYEILPMLQAVTPGAAPAG